MAEGCLYLWDFVKVSSHRAMVQNSAELSRELRGKVHNLRLHEP